MMDGLLKFERSVSRLTFLISSLLRKRWGELKVVKLKCEKKQGHDNLQNYIIKFYDSRWKKISGIKSGHKIFFNLNGMDMEKYSFWKSVIKISGKNLSNFIMGLQNFIMSLELWTNENRDNQIYLIRNGFKTC